MKKQAEASAKAFFAQHKDTIPYHTSYLLAQQDNIAGRLKQLRAANPNLPLTKVVAAILNELPDNMAPRLVRELTLFIIETWENTPAIAWQEEALQ